MADKYKVVSLFSGAMGLDLGMHSTGRFELSACVETYAHVRDGAAQSLTGLAAALRAADLSTVDAANAQVRQQDRDIEKTQEQERVRGYGYGMER